MVHADNSETKKYKPTGRKNAPRDKSGKFDRKILDNARTETINPREIMTDSVDKIVIDQVLEKSGLDLIESIQFKNGENTLTINFSKKHNRMFRIQVFLNDKYEVRPVTYTGSSTGYAFWNFLKGALK